MSDNIPKPDFGGRIPAGAPAGAPVLKLPPGFSKWKVVVLFRSGQAIGAEIAALNYSHATVSLLANIPLMPDKTGVKGFSVEAADSQIIIPA